MTSLTSAYTSMTGLLTYSRALDVIGDNVANLNTIGFKATDLMFESVPPIGGAGHEGGRSPNADVAGYGSIVTGTRRRFTQGEIRDTGVATNLAVSGDGFFVLKSSGKTFYTRNGQFDLDVDGNLVDANGKKVQGFLAGTLQDVVIDRNKTNPPSATALVNFSGNLSLGSTTHSLDVKVFDADGTQRTLKATFTNSTSTSPGTWTVNLKDDNNVDLLNGQIKFEGAGTPSTGFSTLQFNLVSAGGTSKQITLDFGRPGTFDGATSFSGGTTSTLVVSKTDGYGVGRLNNFSFDERGLLTLQYSNGQKEESYRIALATFADPQLLVSGDGGLFRLDEGDVQIGMASENGFGALKPQSVELANVELSREFADILILQRGFQASSQVLNVTSKMIEDIYNSVSGRG